ncbi:hypothetical protein, partial [Micromonospora sp. 15K316]|uniref:hypothetical protein n=1 Tax=Micromonospora sp. 15K316 TaxID=2530376 RepID=UPI001A9DCEF9
MLVTRAAVINTHSTPVDKPVDNRVDGSASGGQTAYLARPFRDRTGSHMCSGDALELNRLRHRFPRREQSACSGVLPPHAPNHRAHPTIARRRPARA